MLVAPSAKLVLGLELDQKILDGARESVARLALDQVVEYLNSRIKGSAEMLAMT
jgi:hypothetical protein